MTRPKKPHGESTVYLGSDGRWHGRVTVGVRDDSSADRRHVARKSEAAVRRAVRELERKRADGILPAAGVRWTVASWLEHWLENIARPSIRWSSYDAYRIAVHNHLVPNLGRHRLERLEPEHLERLYRKMIDSGLKPATAHQVHRTIRTALGEAHRRRQVAQNVATLARAPKVEQQEVEPYSIEEVRRILKAASEGRNAARWAIALALGLRQGEVLGLHWPDVELDAGILKITTSRARPVYEHGCRSACGKTPGRCPSRIQLNADDGPTKSSAGKRRVGLPAALVELLREHRREQESERAIAAQLWVDTGRVFTDPFGQAIKPNSDYHAWKALLKRAGVRDGRLHDARHTAATVLLVLGVPERTVMGVMGWSTTGMAARYQHVTDPIRREVAGLVDGLIWAPDETD
ncbi:tyrosine-type recombinase/integrase [Microlunatus ginsengisoli]|uniref:Site-specific integrase n=1 Tax=Microlunatus ginsengisoli TaxID=363863 RepID=A0ABP7AN19_9ACTN